MVRFESTKLQHLTPKRSIESRDFNGVLYEPDTLECRRAGEWLAGGYFRVLWVKLGDLDYFAQQLMLRGGGAAHGRVRGGEPSGGGHGGADPRGARR